MHMKKVETIINLNYKKMPKPPTEFEEFDLYNGKCRVRFYPNSHRYTVNGKPASGSVTGIIGIKDKSGGLVPWAVALAVNYLRDKILLGHEITEQDFLDAENQHSIKKIEAATVGSFVHDWVEEYIKFTLKVKGYSEMPEMPEMKEAQIGVNAFLDWVSENKVKFISSERVVYSKKYDYIGKMDVEAKVNGQLCLLDWKTSNDLRNDYYMQTAAYVRADEEESGKEYQGRWLIRLAKETEKQYDTRMQKKNDERARKGKDAITFPPYQVFDPKFLDADDSNIDRDFKSFLACKTLKKFEDDTGFWSEMKNK